MKKAYLVQFVITTRVICEEIDLGKDGQAAITAAVNKIMKQPTGYVIGDNCTEISLDDECPYDPQNDENLSVFEPHLSSEFIGWQIESADGLHDLPDGYHSFEIMSTNAAEAFMKCTPNPEKWKMVGIKDGDIENPTLINHI